MKRGFEILVLCLLALLLLLTRAQTAFAASIVVDSTSYETLPTINGNCTILEALYAAQHDSAMDACPAGSGSDVITLPAGTFLLGQSDPTSFPNVDFSLPVDAGTVSLVGAGPDQTILQADPQGYSTLGIFIVRNSAQVSLQGMTLRNGYTSSNYGGAIRNQATIHVQDVWFIHNTSNEGGAIANSGTATIEDSVFFDNVAASGKGGAIRNFSMALPEAALAIANTAIYSNTATSYGGGLSNESSKTALLSNVAIYENRGSFGGGVFNNGQIQIDRSQIYDNAATFPNGSSGAGIINSGTVTITQSTISGNAATFNAGIFNVGNGNSAPAYLTVSESIISGNTAADGAGLGNGPFGNASLMNVTVSGNTATAGVAGIINGSSLELTNVTIADNHSSSISGLAHTGGTTHVRNTIVSNAEGTNCSGAITSDGNNLDSGNSCAFLASGDLTNTDPLLSALADNGGETLTHALGATSPALDAGDDAICPSTDQRGAPRPTDGDGDLTARCDMGAYEADSAPPAVTPTQTAFPILTPTVIPIYTYTPTNTRTPTLVPTPTSTLRAPTAWYVAVNGSDANSCLTGNEPCLTINGALAKGGILAGDTIKVAVGTYAGTGNQVVLVDKSVTISGGWDANFTTQAGLSTLDAEGARRGLTTNNSLTITLDHLRIVNGSSRRGGFADFGGGIYQLFGTMVLNYSIIENNDAKIGGGGIYSSGTLTVNRSEIRNNTSGATGTSGGDGGAGIESFNTLTLNASTVRGNTLVGSFHGSGIRAGITLTLNNSTVSDNHSSIGGEGIYGFVATMNVFDSTITQNDHYGLYAVKSTVFLRNSLLAGNGTDCYNNVNGYDGTVTSLGYNLAQNGGNCTWGATDLTGVSPQVDVPGDNGGPTYTQALLAGSPAIDAGDPANCPATDQRGYARPQDGNGDGTARCDIGAFEADAVATPTATSTATLTDMPTATGTGTATATATQTATNLAPSATPTATATQTPTATGTNLPPTSTGTATATVTLTPSLTPTFTATATFSPTATLTVDPCASAPGAPGLVAPANNAASAKPKVVVSWNGVACATRYVVQARQDKKKGTLLMDKSVTGLSVKVKKLVRGHVYFWRVQACADVVCGKWSGWRKFRITP